MNRDIALPADVQTPFDAAVVIPTILRPTLERAVRSVFAQDLPGRIQLLIGIDVAEGDPALLDQLRRECPPHILVTVCALPYSTSVRHGGLYPNRYSGSLRTVLTFAANSQYVAYLDDDNWWATDHLSDLKTAIEGKDWAYSLRVFTEPESGEPICIDDWESVGPGAGIFKERFGGFVDPSTLMINKMTCRDVIPLWSLSPFDDGSGEDRLVFSALTERFSGARTGRATSFYTINERDPNHPVRLQMMRERGVVLPADKRNGIEPLANVVASFPQSTAPSANGPPSDRLLDGVMDHLKPREIVVLNAGGGDVALTLAEKCQALELEATIVATDDWTPEQYRASVMRLGRQAVALPPDVGDGAAFLAKRRVAVDLAYLSQFNQGRMMAAAWALLRRGGLLMAQSEITDQAQQFAADAGSELLPADIDGVPFWVLQKI